jgi:methionine--tRNA ligase beta chain
VEQISESLITIEHFAQVDLRVGIITSAEPISSSKKLLKLQVDIGEKTGSRQILAGIAKYYSPQDLIGRRVVIVANLSPATLAGETSNGMVLAGASVDRAVLELMLPGESLPIGARVM